MKTVYTLTANIYRREGANAPKLHDAVLRVGTDIVAMHAGINQLCVELKGHGQDYFAADFQVNVATDFGV